MPPFDLVPRIVAGSLRVPAARPSRPRRSGLGGWALAALVAAGCGGFEPEPDVLRLVRFDQAGEAGVFLNETLVLHFDAPLDRTSVTRASVHIHAPGGGEAKGELEVRRRQLRFRPALPRAGDLSDGGFRPDTTYRVELRGFPWPDALRGRNGAPLSSGWTAEFRTATADPARRTPLFQDETLDRASPLRLLSPSIPPAGPLLLECDEPLDPTTLRGEDFELLDLSGDEVLRVALRAELAANEPQRALVELHPVHTSPAEPRELYPGVYHLWLDVAGSRLTDFGGHKVPPAWIRPIAVQVGELAAGPQQSLRVEFVPPFRATPAAVPGADGLARWDGDVLVPFPREAGDGRDGEVRLEGDVASDVAATRLHVPPDAVAELSAPGVVVLRAQGSLRIAGGLRRRLVPEELARRPVESNSEWLQRTRAAWPLPEYSEEEETFAGADTLEDWLASLGADAPPFTVLVAGGDLWIEGDVNVDGPLVLAQGGRLRVTGEVRARSVRRLGRGGGSGLDATNARLALSLTPPARNPLRDTYRFGVTSSPISPRGVHRWLSARVEGHPGTGTYRVLFVGERERAGRVVEVTDPAEDLAELGDCDAVRLRVELEVGPADLWDPPRVDFVDLAWE